jgi:putative oxidoreductase
MFPQLAKYTGFSLLLLRLIVSLVFVTSGINHLNDTKARAASLGLSENFTRFLGIAEVFGALGVAFGFLLQLAAAGLTLIMFGAIQRKIVVWHTGFWGEKNSGWHYELMFVTMIFVIICSGGGSLLIWK